MNAVKARKQGNSLVITLPATLGIKEGEEFYLIKKDNGSLTLIPKVADIFAVAEEGAFYEPDLKVDYSPRGGEVDGV